MGPAALLALGLLCAAGAAGAAPWKHLTEQNGLPGRQIQFVERYGDDMWVGTLGGLVVFRGGKPATVVKDEAVWDVLPIGKDRYWIGSATGILQLDGTDVVRSLTGPSVGSLAKFGDDGVWAVAEQNERMSLLEYRDAKWQPVRRFQGMSVTELFPTRKGTVWVLIETNGLVAADPAVPAAQWVRHLEGINVTSFCEDAKGRVWCGTWGRGVMLLEDGAWRRFLEKEDAAITTIRQDGAGNIWAATNANGLWQFDGQTWTNHLRAEGNINILQVTSDGRVFVSSQAVCALRVWTGKSWEKILDAPAMFRSVVLGPEGKLWAGNTLEGLYIEP